MTKIWCDFVEREFLQGEFRQLTGFDGKIDSNITESNSDKSSNIPNKSSIKVSGATSNPSIFANALKQKSYADSIISLKNLGLKPAQIYESLALQDIKLASEILMPQWLKDRRDGLISLEINPLLSDNAPASIDEGVRLWHALGCKNAMIKVPATPSGYEVMEALMLRGVNVNATLIFSKEQMNAVLEAFLRTLDSNARASLNAPQGVISVFVSRFDRAVDSKLPLDLQGRLGIANAIEIYSDFKRKNTSPNIRILFASTGVKALNSVYSTLQYYVYPLGFKDCINTLPLETLRSVDFNALANGESSFDSKQILHRLDEFNINLQNLQDSLLNEGLKAFETSYEEMLGSL